MLGAVAVACSGCRSSAIARTVTSPPVPAPAPVPAPHRRSPIIHVVPPLTDEEKRRIVARFRDLRKATAIGDARMYGIYSELRRSYRGKSQALVDTFATMQTDVDRQVWVLTLADALCEEIEISFWIEAAGSAGDDRATRDDAT